MWLPQNGEAVAPTQLVRSESSSTVIERNLTFLFALRMARNTSFIPAPPPGEISKLTISMHADDDAFKVLWESQQQLINDAYEEVTIRELFITSMELPSGPCAVIAVIQASAASKA